MQLLLPQPDLALADGLFQGDLIYGLGASDRLDGDFRLVLAGEIFTTFFAHCLLPFLAGYHLKLLFEKWGPLCSEPKNIKATVEKFNTEYGNIKRRQDNKPKGRGRSTLRHTPPARSFCDLPGAASPVQ